MPLQVDIKVNGKLLSTLSIARLTPLRGVDYAHPYAIWEEYNADRPADREQVVFFHRYDEGHQACVASGLEAWRAERWRAEDVESHRARAEQMARDLDGLID